MRCFCDADAGSRARVASLVILRSTPPYSSREFVVLNYGLEPLIHSIMLKIGQFVIIYQREHIDCKVLAPLHRLKHASGVYFPFYFLKDSRVYLIC